MLEKLHRLPAAESLDLAGYRSDFQRHFWTADVTWKLERRLTFREPYTPSWSAMAQGDWARSLSLAAGMRAERAEHQRELDRHGIIQRRIRFVCNPPTPYLQWELQLLFHWAELGEQIRVLPVEAAEALEGDAVLPEVVILGDRRPDPVMYEIGYTDGLLSGARRFDDLDVIESCRNEIRELWERGGDLLPYFHREIQNLPPPPPQGV
ncbi:hypothetical protein Sru01_50870 [Sphaerisporangium rufum]|uniref:DUF6879 domain-containing protein n=1 Tax=Sphaerisporangium rufum TaxID=1381558 RepID=A0A919RA27_9ACTN|nr:DUF6879 family protein [Sphaerisporangium rufum]GII80105.1 hypothetical protein Sru01_50870 [Sphaerisporangium rufum]